jgi:hypothetical protein
MIKKLQSPISFHCKKNQHVDNDAFMMNSSSSKEYQCGHGEELNSTKKQVDLEENCNHKDI